MYVLQNSKQCVLHDALIPELYTSYLVLGQNKVFFKSAFYIKCCIMNCTFSIYNSGSTYPVKCVEEINNIIL